MAALTRFGHIHVWIILVYSLNTVSCKVEEIRVYTGDAALLRCAYNSPLPEKVTISWRDKDDSNVLDILKNIPNFKAQSEKFKDRVKYFPDLYMKGNFSIVLKDVRQEDDGFYECHIRVDNGSQQRVRLTVTGERVKETITSSGPAGDAAAVPSTSVQLLLLSAPLWLLSSLNCL